MTQTAIRALFLLLVPLAGLAALWAQSETLSRQGTDWEVPIQGYDPRDLLRGHYVEFNYDWPTPSDEREDEEGFGVFVQHQNLCLIGDAPTIVEAIPFEDATDPEFERCKHKLSVQPGSVYGYDSLNRGRLYVGQERALELEEGLRDREQIGIVTFRQRDDGVLTPLDIRFRPLTDEGQEERDALRSEEAVIVDAADAAIEAANEEADAPETDPSEEE
ncbi:MAG: GDYXXLXY domain-containing protein [Pseudomonadota bacterium]